MRKISYALAATIFVLSSCVQNDPYVPQQGSELNGKLFINEVNGTGGPSGADAEKYVEFYNNTDADISLESFVLEYGGKATWQGKAADVVPAGGYFLIRGAKTTYPGMSQGLSSRNPNVNLTLFDAAGNTVDYYEKVADLIGTPLETMDHMRIPDGGKWYYVSLSAETPDAPNLSDPNDPAVQGEMPSMEKKLQIESVTVTPAKPTPEDAAVFVAKVTDVSTISSVVLKWKLNGADQTDISMTKNADGLYEATIGKQADGTTVNWTIVATNAQGTSAQQTGTVNWAAPTADYTKLKLNEVNGVGKWFEIYNSGDVAISLEGVTAYYSNKDPEAYNLTWTGDATMTIPAKGFFTTPTGDKGASLGTGLSANNANVRLQLRAPDGTTVLDTYEKLIDINDGYDAIKNNTHVRIPDGTGSWYYNPDNAGTPGATNGTSTTGFTQFGAEDGVIVLDYTKLVLNEIDGVNKTIELYNNGSVALPLKDVKIVKVADDVSDWWIGTDAAGSIPAGGYVLLSNTVSSDNPLYGNGGISPKKSVQFDLYDPDGDKIDTFLRGDAAKLDSSISDVTPNSYQRIPNGTGDWKQAAPTNGAANATSGMDIPQQ